MFVEPRGTTEFRRARLQPGAARVFIRIKITLDGQRDGVTRAQLEISPEFPRRSEMLEGCLTN